MKKTGTDVLNASEEKREGDYREKNEKIPIGSIVATHAHPFTASNKEINISNDIHFTPPLMVVSEKKYGAKYDSVTGVEEDNESYKCIYYSTISGSLEENWFKQKELKLINDGDSNFFKKYKDNNLEKLKKQLFGRMAILSTIDLELGKKKIWYDSDGLSVKLKMKNQLDYLPPLGTIIDIKPNEDYQKYNEKEGKISHRKSKLIVKLRWLNNTTAKYSEEYFPMVGLRLVEEADLELKDYSPTLHYLLEEEIVLEGDDRGKVMRIPVQLERVIWNHYCYKYCFINLFTQNSIETDEVDLKTPLDLSRIIDISPFNWGALAHFSMEKVIDVKDKWYEIEYSDKNERYTKRIIKVIELTEEEQEDGTKKRMLQANCLLRDGEIRHFRVSRIKSYRELKEDFIKTFVDKK